jgi:hypothetical protein
MVILVPRYCFCAHALVRNCDIRQKLTKLAMNTQECVLLAAQAGSTAQAGSIYCFCTAEKIIMQLHNAGSLKKQAGFNTEPRKTLIFDLLLPATSRCNCRGAHSDFGVAHGQLSFCMQVEQTAHRGLCLVSGVRSRAQGHHQCDRTHGSHLEPGLHF